MDPDLKTFLIVASCIVIVLGSSISGCMYGYPIYNVYSMRMEGQANLAHSLANAQVQVQDAQGVLDAAKHLADADIERARGVAEANRIIGSSLKDNEAYLKWLFVDALKDTKNQVIYVPTEAQLPILEATRKPPTP